MKKLSKRIISLVLALVMAMPMLLVVPSTASAQTISKTLFHYTFDNADYSNSSSKNLDKVDSDYGIGVSTRPSGNNSGNNPASLTDHFSFSNGLADGALNDNIRLTSYRTHWRIDFDFAINNYPDKNKHGDHDHWKYILALYGGTSNLPFGITVEGKVTSGNNFIDGVSEDIKYPLN